EKSINWQPQNSGDSLWRMLLSDRLDAAVGDYSGLTTLSVYRNGRVRFLQPALRVDALRIGVLRQRAALLPRLNLALKRMQANGELDMLYRDYGARPLSELARFAEEVAPR
ncbi:MAG: transporter substrate-binding domain-containing protein, partial [Pseudomonadota bacterium]|nr:transporter substrate-binding domain-containing protein [Pseudomonadota bacterium]